MKKDDVYSGIVVMIVSLVLLGLSFGIHEDIVPGDTLGSRFFPRLVVILLAVCSVAIILNGLKTKRSEKTKSTATTSGRGAPTPSRALWTIGLSFAYVILFNILGVIILTPLVMFGMLWAWGVKSRTNLILVPIIGTAVLYLIFGYAFEIMLPMGIFG